MDRLSTSLRCCWGTDRRRPVVDYQPSPHHQRTSLSHVHTYIQPLRVTQAQQTLDPTGTWTTPKPPPSPSTIMTATSSSSSSFQTPVKRLFTPEDLTAFQESQTHADVLGFIADLNKAILGVKLTDECHISPVCVIALALPTTPPSRRFEPNSRLIPLH